MCFNILAFQHIKYQKFILAKRNIKYFTIEDDLTWRQRCSGAFLEMSCSRSPDFPLLAFPAASPIF